MALEDRAADVTPARMLLVDEDSERKSINKATKRLLRVLTEFIGADRPLGVSELSRRLDMTRNMVHRALVTLSDERLLYKLEETGRYILSYNLAKLQNTAHPSPDLRRIARPYLERISDILGETVQLAIRSGDYQTIIDGIEGNGLFVMRVKLGHVIPLHVSVASRAILAACRDDEIEDYIARNSPLKRFTASSLATPKEVRKEVAKVRADGYARALGDYNPLAAGFAYALPDSSGRPHGAIAVGGPSTRLSTDWIEAAHYRIAPWIGELQKITALYEAV